MNAASKDKIKILSIYNEAADKSDFLKTIHSIQRYSYQLIHIKELQMIL